MGEERGRGGKERGREGGERSVGRGRRRSVGVTTMSVLIPPHACIEFGWQNTRESDSRLRLHSDPGLYLCTGPLPLLNALTANI